MKRLLERLKQSKVVRVWDHYGVANGSLLAGGIAYAALFSLFPALAIGFTVFGLVLGGDVTLQQRVVDYINEAFSTKVIGMSDGDGFVSMGQLVQTNVLTGVGLISVAVLLFTGLGWVDALRQGIRAVFGLDRLQGPVLAKLLDVGVLVVLGLVVLASVAVSVGLPAASGWVLDRMDVDSALARVLVQLLVEAAVLAVDVALFLTFFLLLARVAVPVRALLGAAVIGAVGLHVLKLGSGLLMSQASGNAYLASAAIVVGLLLWFNLVGRLVLLSAAWGAVTTRDLGIGPTAEDARVGQDVEKSPEPPASQTVAATVARPSYSSRTADRVTIAAGVVLGGIAAAGLGVAGRALRTARGAVRRD